MVVFDGRCGFCTGAVRWLTRLDRSGRVRPVPCQRPGIPETLGLSRSECEAAAWAIEPDGRRHRGGAAMMAALAWAAGQPQLVSLYYLPVLRQAVDVLYRVIACLRPYLPGAVPHCDEYPDDCGGREGTSGGCKRP